MPTLVFEIEDGGQVVAPLEGRMTTGSARSNDIVAEREDIAPHHAEIFRSRGRHLVGEGPQLRCQNLQ